MKAIIVLEMEMVMGKVTILNVGVPVALAMVKTMGMLMEMVRALDTVPIQIIHMGVLEAVVVPVQKFYQ